MGRWQRALLTHGYCVIVTCYVMLADGRAHGQELDRGSAATPANVRDLLANFDVQKLKVAGDWKLTGGVLESPIGERQRIELPGTAPEEYQLQIVVERIQGKDAFGIGLVVDGRHTSILLDAYASQASGLHLINGQGCDRNVTSYKQQIFAPGKRVDVRVMVRRQEVSLVCDGKAIFTWRGDPKDLSLFEGWSVKNPQSLFLAAHQSTFRIHAARLGPIVAETAVVVPKLAPQTVPVPPTVGPPASIEKSAPKTGVFELARDGVSTEL